MWSIVSEVRRLGVEKGCFENCRGVSVSQKSGNRTLCDINNKRIQVLDENGRYLHSWDTVINESRLCPLSVTRYDENTLACVIEGHATLWSCPDAEEHPNDVGKEGVKLANAFGNDELVFPRSIRRNKRGQMLVSDVGRHCLNLYDVNGTLLKSIGSLGTEDRTHFNWPYYISCDDRGRVAVSDSHNRCVKLFDADSLEYLGKFGGDRFSCVTGIAHDATGNGFFYAVDYDDKRMLSFTDGGQFVECIDENMPGAAGDVQLTRHANEILVTLYDGYVVYKN